MASNRYAVGSLGTDQQVYHGCDEAKNEVGKTVPATTNPRDIAMLPFEPGLHDEQRSKIVLPFFYPIRWHQALRRRTQ